MAPGGARGDGRGAMAAACPPGLLPARLTRPGPARRGQQLTSEQMYLWEGEVVCEAGLPPGEKKRKKRKKILLRELRRVWLVLGMCSNAVSGEAVVMTLLKCHLLYPSAPLAIVGDREVGRETAR